MDFASTFSTQIKLFTGHYYTYVRAPRSQNQILKTLKKKKKIGKNR